MARLFDYSEEYIDESMVAIEELADLCQLEKNECLTVAQCASLLCVHNKTEKLDRSEDIGTYIMVAFNDIRLGELQVLHPETLLSWTEYLKLLKAGMYSGENKMLAPMVTAKWLVPLDECERWYRTKGLDIDLSAVKADLDKIKAGTSFKFLTQKHLSLSENPSIYNINHQSPIDDCFSEEECSLFDPLTKKQIGQLFTVVHGEDWIKFFDKASRNGLDSARYGKKPYKYNPAGVANWLYREGRYRSNTLARILSENLPARSRQHRENLLDSRGLLEEN
ncbi:hypothetical protein [Nitrosomonas ureae]|uniref:Uncharacterized protein n=1 Tax=Nitrosomonas ureae TaxID=44577 RepID=A0A1H5T2G4_9PROT|nr:hypothetical protein [Nitrosomonas ureae]SEF56348.1 hypothetical protein SAMN05216334_103192 [Nitrosomonas ureae]